MRKEKGFTLVELLAVVLIIGILLLLAVPAVNRYLKKGTDQYYYSLEDTIEVAGRDYVDDYRSLFPKEVGNVTIVELNELVENHYIDELVDKNGNSCDAKVTVKKTAKNNYEYYSCLMCENYQTKGDNCNYSEEDNITSETKNYSIVVEKEKYIVGQGENFTIPTAKAYYLDQLVNGNVIGSPRLVDTNILGTTIITYSYQGVKKQIIVEVVDQVSPSIPQVVLRYDNASGNSYKGGWYSNNIYVEFQSTDYTKPNLVGSGIAYYEVSSDGINWNKISGNNQIYSNNGDFTYYVRSVDHAGNISEANSYNLKIDKDTPTCSIVVTGTLGQNDWYISDVLFRLEIIETISGISSQSLSNNSITSNTTGQKIDGSVTSSAGKVGSCSVTVKIDKEKPQPPTITASDNLSSGKWHRENITLTTSGSSSISGITYYIDTNDNPIIERDSVTVSDNITGTTYYTKACNGAGTCSDISDYLLKIDKETPTCNIIVTGILGQNDWYTSDVSLSLDVTETNSGILAQSLSQDSITINTEGQQITGSVTSGAGKIGTCSVTVKVDKETPQAPTLTANDSILSGNWHNANTTLIASSSSSTSGMTYYIDTNDNPTTERDSITISENTEGTIYYAKACNGAGTCSDVSNYVLMLDNGTPSAPVIQGGSNTWVSSPLTISIQTPGEAFSGVKHYEYYISTSSDIPSSNVKVTGTTAGEVIIDNEGINYIWYRTVSNSGIKSEWSSPQVSNFTKFTGIPSNNYAVGSTVNYANLSWKVISDNGNNVTLVLASHYKNGAYGGTSWNDSSVKNIVNNDFVNANSIIKNDIENSGILYDSSSNSYVRIPKKSETSTNISNDGNLPFWLIDITSNQAAYATSSGSLSYTTYTKGEQVTGYAGYGTTLESISYKSDYIGNYSGNACRNVITGTNSSLYASLSATTVITSQSCVSTIGTPKALTLTAEYLGELRQGYAVRTLRSAHYGHFTYFTRNYVSENSRNESACYCNISSYNTDSCKTYVEQKYSITCNNVIIGDGSSDMTLYVAGDGAYASVYANTHNNTISNNSQTITIRPVITVRER